VNEQGWQAEQFERHRPHLQAVAYPMLGSVSEAEDAVQEAWLRLSRSNTDAVANLGGWLTTVVGRVCLDTLRSRRSRREDYVGSWLPEPIVSLDSETDPEQEAMLADSVGLALLVVLETLTPAERLAFVLHDMFGMALTRSRRSSSARPTPPASSRAAPAAACAAVHPSPTPTLPSSARSSTRSSPPPDQAISTPCSPCSTPTSSSGSTAAALPRARGHPSSEPKRSPITCSSAPRSRDMRDRRSSTVPPVSSSRPAGGRSPSSPSPWQAGASLRSNSSPTRTS
jgi:RNA polymerase sigma factor (sigma-70 family)